MGAWQRFFIIWVFFLLSMFVVFGPRPSIQASDKKVIIAEKKIAVTLPLGWYESDRKRDGVEAGFNTRDNRLSIFFRSLDGGNATLQDLMDLTIANFDVDKRFYLKKVDEYKNRAGRRDSGRN